MAALIKIASEDGADFLMSQFDKLQNGEEHSKIAIHCMAGVGRTGTLMGMINSIICLKEQHALENKELSIFSIIRRVREQRFEMCETRFQYKFIYDSVQKYFKTELESIKEVDENNE